MAMMINRPIVASALPFREAAEERNVEGLYRGFHTAARRTRCTESRGACLRFFNVLSSAHCVRPREKLPLIGILSYRTGVRVFGTPVVFTGERLKDLNLEIGTN